MEASEPTAPVLAAGPLNQAPPDRQRHRAARAHADRHGRHLERHRQHLQLPVAVLCGRHDLDEPHRRDEHDLRARRLRRRPLSAPARDRHQPRRHRHAASAATAKVISAAAREHRPAGAQRHRAARRRPSPRRTGTWTGNGNGYSYQWQRDWRLRDIADATNAELHADRRRRRRDACACVVTATNPDGTATAASVADRHDPQRAAGEHRPADRQRHRAARSTLTGTAGTWSGIGNSDQLPVAVLAGRHARGPRSAARPSATLRDRRRRRRQLSAPARDRHQPRRHRAAASTATAKVTSAPPVNSVRPTITGTAQRASTLIGTPGTWSGIGNAYAYQWQRSTTARPGRTSRARRRTGYELTVADVGASVRLLVTASNPDATVTATSIRDRDDPQRAAGQHRPPDAHRHRPARRRR